jgi:RHS repeat-associated protein
VVALGVPGAGFHFYHFDQLGNTLALTNGAGKVSTAYAYLPFGAVAKKTGIVANPFTYVGAFGVMDEGNGLFFMKNRYYDATTGRFIQKDPIGMAGGINLYRYAANNPVDWIDPEGEFFHLVIMAVGAVETTLALHKFLSVMPHSKGLEELYNDPIPKPHYWEIPETDDTFTLKSEIRRNTTIGVVDTLRAKYEWEGVIYRTLQNIEEREKRKAMRAEEECSIGKRGKSLEELLKLAPPQGKNDAWCKEHPFDCF